jgi:hypothetical protein
MQHNETMIRMITFIADERMEYRSPITAHVSPRRTDPVP